MSDTNQQQGEQQQGSGEQQGASPDASASTETPQVNMNNIKFVQETNPVGGSPGPRTGVVLHEYPETGETVVGWLSTERVETSTLEVILTD